MSLDALPAFANGFWEAVGDEKIFLFHGEMGAGKTTIIEALCAAKGVRDGMSSPTFSLINQYSYTENGTETFIYHMDLYRLRNEDEAIGAGVEDAAYGGDLCFVEWPERAPGLFDNGCARVFIEPLNDTLRRVELRLPGTV